MPNQMPINPVTIRGHLPFSNAPSNLSIGRLWIGTDKVADTSHSFNPTKPGPKWEKPVTFILWGQNMDEAKTMVSNDDDFIAAVKRLKANYASYSVLPESASLRRKQLGQERQGIAVDVWGRETVSEDSNVCGIIFDYTRNVAELDIILHDENKKTLGSAVLVFNKFMTGLGHLFPKGELE